MVCPYRTWRGRADELRSTVVDADDRLVDLTDDQSLLDDDAVLGDGLPPQSGSRPGAFSDGDPVLPRVTWDDTDAGWGQHRSRDDDRLLADRPPHWE